MDARHVRNPATAGPFTPIDREERTICSFCASLIAEDARSCPQCGAPQPGTPSGRWRRGTLTIEREEYAFLVEPPNWMDGSTTRRASWLGRLLKPPRQHPISHRVPSGSYSLPMRSFRLHAVIAFVLYFPFFLPGLIASAVWWREATTIERRTGRTPPGKGCLTGLLLWGVLVTAFWVMIFALV